MTSGQAGRCAWKAECPGHPRDEHSAQTGMGRSGNGGQTGMGRSKSGGQTGLGHSENGVQTGMGRYGGHTGMEQEFTPDSR